MMIAELIRDKNWKLKMNYIQSELLKFWWYNKQGSSKEFEFKSWEVWWKVLTFFVARIAHSFQIDLASINSLSQ